MAATFRTRPRLLATVRPSFASPVCVARGLLANTMQTRQYAAPRRRLDPRMRGQASQVKQSQMNQEAMSSMVEDMMDNRDAVNSSEMAVLAPRTLVPLPPSRAPRDWRSFLTYYKEIFMQRFADRLQILQQTQELKEGRLWHRATFRAQRKGVVEAALNLHAAMSHDLARGGQAERTHLTQFCVPKLARSLVAAIESRPAGKRYEWERVALTGKPLWPRLVDHKWTDIDLGYAKKASFRQAVVGIKSQQKLTELDRRGKPVKTKEMELLEYVVLWCRVDKVNRTFGDWQLYGTLKETSYEELIKERELTKSIGDMHAARGLMQRKKQLEEK